MIDGSDDLVIADAQVHIWDRNTPPLDRQSTTEVRHFRDDQLPLSASQLVSLMSEAGVNRAVLIPPSRDENRIDVALKAVQQFPKRFAIVAALALGPQSESHLMTIKIHPELHGVRVQFSPRQGLLDKDHRGFWGLLQSAQVPVMLSAPGRTPELRQLARQFPELRLILDHMNVKVGGSDPAMLYERFVDSLPPLYELAEEPNVAVKISVLPRYANDSFPFISLHPHILNVIRTFGAGRCMWGSDVTQLPCSYSDWLKAMLMAIGHLPRTDQVAVMGGTLSRWLNWPKDMG